MALLLLCVAMAGGLGGVVNAIMSDGGFRLPRRQATTDGSLVTITPGWIGNVIIGAVAAAVSWGLYGPLASQIVVMVHASDNGPKSEASLTLGSLMGAVIVGIGGARWLTNEVDKSLLKAAASKAAAATQNNAASRDMAGATPLGVFKIAMKL